MEGKKKIFVSSKDSVVIFEVAEEEIRASRQLLMCKSTYFREMLKDINSPDNEIKILLPNWTRPSAVRLLINSLKGISLGSISNRDLQRLLWLSDFFHLDDLQVVYINMIINHLNKENVLLFLVDTFTKLSSIHLEEGDDKHTELNPSWLQLFSQCIQIVALNIHYLIEYSRGEMFSLHPSIQEEILMAGFQLFALNKNIENLPLIQMQMNLLGCSNVFELIEITNQQIIERNMPIFTKPETKPYMTWKLSSLKNNFYKESEPFSFKGTYWVLVIWSFVEEGLVQIGIKHSKSPTEIEEQLNSSYYGQSKYFLNSTALQKKGLKTSKEEGLKITNGNNKVPNHCILTIVSFVRIVELEESGEGSFGMASLITASKAPTVLRHANLQDVINLKGRITIELSFNLEFTHSCILNYISKAFHSLYDKLDIAKLPKNQFQVILKHKYLNIKCEDDVLLSFCLWLEGHSKNITGTEKNENSREFQELIENINWPYVSIQALSDIIKNFPNIRELPAFSLAYSEEVSRRLEGKIQSEPPRYSYKYLLNKEGIEKPFIYDLVQALLDPTNIISQFITKLRSRINNKEEERENTLAIDREIAYNEDSAPPTNILNQSN